MVTLCQHSPRTVLLSYIAILALAASPVSSQHGEYPPKGSAEQRADYERGQASQVRFEQELFVDAGFQPIDALAADKRTVKRALFEDPYMMLPVPGVEIERMPNGTITLKVIGRTGASAPAILPASAWAQLISLQGTFLRPKPYVPWDPPKASAPVPAPPPMCHGWLVRFGAADDTGVKSGSWAQCGGSNQPGAAFAVRMAELAVSTRPSCKFDEADPFGAFNACFSRHPQSSADPNG